ncbi:hypothetical protein [Orrella marina]|uniref:Uncharacterized protein n=1 Tax=Orrella marina TaxID=2163011 RepID=A0A2R4XH74_9BURK|nr:hypothetical protein [Orrella marina]AWB33156.1 hypothetical protein DBV39_04885 [Orrella marina]
MKRHGGRASSDPEKWQQYIKAIRDPARLNAMCEDYRTSITIDLDHDRQDRATSAKRSQEVVQEICQFFNRS